MDHHRLVVIEDHDLKEAPRTVGSDVEIPVPWLSTRSALRTACSMSESVMPCLWAASAISTSAGYLAC